MPEPSCSSPLTYFNSVCSSPGFPLSSSCLSPCPHAHCPAQPPLLPCAAQQETKEGLRHPGRVRHLHCRHRADCIASRRTHQLAASTQSLQGLNSQARLLPNTQAHHLCGMVPHSWSSSLRSNSRASEALPMQSWARCTSHNAQRVCRPVRLPAACTLRHTHAVCGQAPLS